MEGIFYHIDDTNIKGNFSKSIDGYETFKLSKFGQYC